MTRAEWKLSLIHIYEKEIDQSVISDYKEISGYGISVMAREKKVFAGNTKLMDTECIEYTTCEMCIRDRR